MREHEKLWMKNTNSLNWKLKINWIQNTIQFASSLLYLKIDLFRCRKSKFFYQNSLFFDIIYLNISLMKDTWAIRVFTWISISNFKSFLIQHYVLSTMFSRSTSILFLFNIAIWRIKNKSSNEKKKTYFEKSIEREVKDICECFENNHNETIYSSWCLT